MVVRNSHPTDLRKFVISITDDGRKLLKKQAETQLEFATDMMEYLGEADAKAYIRIITKLAHRDDQSK